MLSVWYWRGRRPSVSASSDGCFEASDDLGNVMTIEFRDSSVELSALETLHQKLSDLFATLQVLGPHLPHFPLLGCFAFRVRRTERVLGELPLMVLEGDLGL